MYLGQTIVDLTPLIKALSDAGVTGLLLVAVLFGLPGFLLIRMILRQNAKTQDSLVDAINTLTQNQKDMQTGARRRDDQIDKMNKIEELRNEEAKKQSVIFAEQNTLLEKLNRNSESGNTWVKTLGEVVVNSTKDTSTAVQALETSFVSKSNELQSQVNKLPAEVAAVFEASLKQMHDEIARLVTVVTDGNDTLAQKVADKVAETLQPQILKVASDVLRDCLALTADMAKELDVAEAKIDQTDPIAKPKLSPVDGEVNRAIIDGDKPDPEPPPSGAIDPATGEARIVA